LFSMKGCKNYAESTGQNIFRKEFPKEPKFFGNDGLGVLWVFAPPPIKPVRE
jgi:hypothetical protein